MNKVQLVGRLTKDPDLKNTSNQVAFCQFTVAVDRRFKDNEGNRQADFINCVAWRQTAAFINQYFKKGSRIGVCGSIQTRTYETNEGQRVYVTEVVVDEAEFVESNNNSNGTKPQAQPPKAPEQQIDVPSLEQELEDDGPLGLPFEF